MKFSTYFNDITIAIELFCYKNCVITILYIFVTLFVPRVKEDSFSILGFNFMYSIWRDARIRTRDAATVARCAHNDLHTSLFYTFRRCHTTYVTTYDSQQEEECEDNFRKNCFIEYETIAFNQTAKVKQSPVVLKLEPFDALFWLSALHKRIYKVV